MNSPGCQVVEVSSSSLPLPRFSAALVRPSIMDCRYRRGANVLNRALLIGFVARSERLCDGRTTLGGAFGWADVIYFAPHTSSWHSGNCSSLDSLIMSGIKKGADPDILLSNSTCRIVSGLASSAATRASTRLPSGATSKPMSAVCFSDQNRGFSATNDRP